MSFKYEHVFCKCGGVIGMYNGETPTCSGCHKEYKLSEIVFDITLNNPYTGWIFPLKIKNNRR